jgi:hypothetical protein
MGAYGAVDRRLTYDSEALMVFRTGRAGMGEIDWNSYFALDMYDRSLQPS